MESFFKRNPSGKVTNFSDLQPLIDAATFDHTFVWLPIEQRYAFLQPGSGWVSDEGSGDVLAISTLSLSPFELGDSTDPDPEKNPPGRYIIWRNRLGELHASWFPEADIKNFVRPEVLKAITLPKPKMSPRERITYGRAGEAVERYTIDPTTGNAIPNNVPAMAGSSAASGRDVSVASSKASGKSNASYWILGWVVASSVVVGTGVLVRRWRIRRTNGSSE